MDTSKVLFYCFLIIVCTGLSLVVRNHRRLFLGLMVFFAPISVGFIFRHINGIFLMDVPLVILLVFGIFDNRKFKFYLIGPALFLIFWWLISGYTSLRFDVAISELTRFIRAYLAFLCVANFTRDKKDIYAVLFALFFSVFLIGLLGSLQWRYGSLGLTFLGEPQFRWRARGLFVHPAMLADYLVLVIPVVFRLFVFYKPPKLIYTALLGLVLTVACAALLGTYARGPWLGFAGAMVIMLLYTLFKRKFYPKVVSATAVMVFMASLFAVQYVPTIYSQFTSEYRNKSTDTRVPLMKIGWRVTQDNLLFGVGPGNYPITSHRYVSLADVDEFDLPFDQLCQVVHNTYLLIAAEGGIPSLLVFLWVILYIYWRGWKVLKKKNALISNVGLGILTGYTAFLVGIMAGPDYTQHQIMMLFWILAGFLVVLSRTKTVGVNKKRQLKTRQMANRNGYPAGSSPVPGIDNEGKLPGYR